MRGISAIFISRTVFRNKSDKGTGIVYAVLIRRNMYHQRSLIRSCCKLYVMCKELEIQRTR